MNELNTSDTARAAADATPSVAATAAGERGDNRFFRSNVGNLSEQSATFRANVELLKQISIFADIPNVFASAEAPAALKSRDEQILQFSQEEKKLLEEGAETTQKRRVLRELAKRYAELGDVKKAIGLLIHTDLLSLDSLKKEQDLFTKCDRLCRIILLITEVAAISRSISLPVHIMGMIDVCLRTVEEMSTPLQLQRFGQYEGFEQYANEFFAGQPLTLLQKFGTLGIATAATSEAISPAQATVETAAACATTVYESSVRPSSPTRR